MRPGAKSLLECINNIDEEDLQYIETDLSFYQLVSLGFLLYGDDRARSQFILQKLIILAQNPPQGRGLKERTLATSNILGNYAKSNRQSWRLHIVEALSIIKAKRVLRLMGLDWQEIYHQFLPHVAEISVHIHPMLKALYTIAERLTPDQAGKVVCDINSKYNIGENLRFYDYTYLEVFLLNWLNKHLIRIGDKHLKDCNVEILIEYFKLNDMAGIKDLLVDTINQNLEDNTNDEHELPTEASTVKNAKDSGVDMSQDMLSSTSSNKFVNITIEKKPDRLERYDISSKNAGYLLIINQSNFYTEKDPKYKHLVPVMHDSIPNRLGTNVDRDKLKELFSSYGYTPIVFENLTHIEMLHQIRETVKKSLLKDSIIICILSHGMEGVVFGCNSVPVAINEIKEILTPDTLKGKPKMLIIQACQRNVANIDTKGSTIITDFTPDAYADMLLAMSSIPGTDALRHTEHGSWFVDSLYKLTQKYGDSKHMIDILTAVTHDISNRKGDANEVMLSITSSTLRKAFYLPSRM